MLIQCCSGAAGTEVVDVVGNVLVAMAEEVGVGGGTIVVSDPADVHDTTNRERTSEIDAARVKLWILIMGTIPVAIGRVRVEQGRFYGTAKMR